MQLEIDQGKTKLQVLIKEESKARHAVEPEEDDPRKKIEQESVRKEGMSLSSTVESRSLEHAITRTLANSNRFGIPPEAYSCYGEP